jgi:hypothetical protein
MQLLPEARHDEEGIVDPDTDADHRHEDRRDRVDVGQPGENEEEDERRSDGHDRERDRNRRRDERAENDQEHDERGQEAEQLLRSLLDGRELGIAVELRGDARRLDRLANGVLYRDDLRAIFGFDRLRKLRLRISDASVVREGVRAERIADALDPGLVLRRLELRALELRDRGVDRRLALRRVESLAFGCCKDKVQYGTLLGRELRLDQVGRLLRVGARDLELVLQAAAERRDREDQDCEDAEPADNHAPRVAGVQPRPARKRAGRQTFMSCAPLLRTVTWPLLRHARSPSVGSDFK